MLFSYCLSSTEVEGCCCSSSLLVPLCHSILQICPHPLVWWCLLSWTRESSTTLLCSPESDASLKSKTKNMRSQPPLLTCEGSGKREVLDWVGAWRLVSLEGWRSSASELYVYLAGQRETQIQDPTTCTPHRGFNQLVRTEDTHAVIKCLSYLDNLMSVRTWDKPLNVINNAISNIENHATICTVCALDNETWLTGQ